MALGDPIDFSFLTDRDKRKIGLDLDDAPQTRVETRRERITNAVDNTLGRVTRPLGFVTRDVFGGGVDQSDDQDVGVLGQVGRFAFRNSVGSEGVAGIFQNLGQNIGAFANQERINADNLAATQSVADSRVNLARALERDDIPDSRRVFLEQLQTDLEIEQGQIRANSDPFVSDREVLSDGVTGVATLLTGAGGPAANIASKGFTLGGGGGAIGRAVNAVPFLGRSRLGREVFRSGLQETGIEAGLAIDEENSTQIGQSALNVAAGALLPAGFSAAGAGFRRVGRAVPAGVRDAVRRATPSILRKGKGIVDEPVVVSPLEGFDDEAADVIAQISSQSGFDPARLDAIMRDVGEKIVRASSAEDAENIIRDHLRDFIPLTDDADKIATRIAQDIVNTNSSLELEQTIQKVISDLDIDYLNAARVAGESISVSQARKVSPQIDKVKATNVKKISDVFYDQISDLNRTFFSFLNRAEKDKLIDTLTDRAIKVKPENIKGLESDVADILGVEDIRLGTDIVGNNSRKAIRERITDIVENLSVSAQRISQDTQEMIGLLQEELAKEKQVIDGQLARFLESNPGTKAVRKFISDSNKRVNSLEDTIARLQYNQEISDIQEVLEKGIRDNNAADLPSAARITSSINSLQNKIGIPIDKRTKGYLTYSPNNLSNQSRAVSAIRREIASARDFILEGFLSDTTNARRILQNVRRSTTDTDFVTASNLKAGAFSFMNRVDAMFQNTMSRGLIRAAGSRKAAGEWSQRISQYMLARHMIDVNIADDALKAGSEVAEKLSIFGPDMTNAEANKIIKEFYRDFGDNRAVNAVVGRLRAYSDGKLKLLYEEGLITREQFDILRKKYPNYVPVLKKINSDDTLQVGGFLQRQGDGIDSTIRARVGPGGEIYDPIDSLFYKGRQINNSLADNAQRKTLARAVLRGDEEVINEFYNIRKMDGRSKLRSDEYDVFIDGDRYALSAKDNKYIDFLGKGNRIRSNILEKTFGWYTFYKAALLTKLSPSFKALSIMRDAIESAYTFSGFASNGFGSIKYSKEAFKGISDWQRGLSTPSAQAYEEALKAGLGFGTFSTVIRDDFSSAFSKNFKPRAALKDFNEIVENANELIENTVRFAHFMNARSQGYNVKQATNLALEAGINFSKGGKYTNIMRPLYLFFNAGVQGSANVIKAMQDPRTLMAMMAHATGASVMQEEVNNAMMAHIIAQNPDMDIDPNWRNHLENYRLDSNFIMITGVTKEGTLNYVRIPVPHGLRPVWVGSNGAAQAVRGETSVGRVAAETATSALANFNPLGGNVADAVGGQGDVSKAFTETLAPDLLRPGVSLLQNQNFFGDYIQYYNRPKEDSALNDEGELKDYLKDETDEQIAIKLSEAARSVFGEITDESTLIAKVTDPGSLLHLYDQFINFGIVKEGTEAVNAVTDLVNGDRLGNVDKLPISKSFFGETRPYTVSSKQKDDTINAVINAEGDPKAQRDIVREYFLTSGNAGIFPALKEAGFENMQLGLDGFKSYTSDAEGFIWITAESDDASLDEYKEAHIAKLKKEYDEGVKKNPAYKYFVEYQVASNEELIAAGPSAIFKYMEEQGIDTSKYKTTTGKMRQDFKNTLENKQVALRRAVNPAIEQQYQSLTDTKKNIQNGAQITLDDYRSLQRDQILLYNEGHVSGYDLKRKLKEQNVEYIDSVYLRLIEEFEQRSSGFSTTSDQNIVASELVSLSRDMDLAPIYGFVDDKADLYKISDLSSLYKIPSPSSAFEDYLASNGYLDNL